MSSSDRIATIGNHSAQALYRFEIDTLLQALEVDTSSSPEDDSFIYCGIFDSLTLPRYDVLKEVGDDISDRDQLGLDITQQEVDRAWDAFDSSWDELASSCSFKSPKRSGVRRGQDDDTSTSTSVTRTVMTKTHDGACRDRGTPRFIEIASSDGRSSTASAA